MLIITSATAIVSSDNENGATFTANAEYNMTLNDNTKVVMSPDHKLCSPCVLEHEIGDKQCAWAPSLNKKAVIECKLPCWEVNKWCKKECECRIWSGE
jgi:hypothetical protein